MWPIVVWPGKLWPVVVWPGKLWGQRLYIVVWPGKLLADRYFFIFFIYFNKTYIQILCYNNHAHTSLNQSSDSYDTEFFDRYFHIPLPIVMKHELPFPPRNLPIEFGTNPSTFF